MSLIITGYLLIVFIVLGIVYQLKAIRGLKQSKEAHKKAIEDALKVIKDALKEAQVTIIKEAYLTIDDKDIAAQIADAISKDIAEKQAIELHKYINDIKDTINSVNAG